MKSVIKWEIPNDNTWELMISGVDLVKKTSKYGNISCWLLMMNDATFTFTRYLESLFWRFKTFFNKLGVITKDTSSALPYTKWKSQNDEDIKCQ